MSCGFSSGAGKQKLPGLNDLAPMVSLLMILDGVAVENADKFIHRTILCIYFVLSLPLPLSAA